MKQSPKIKPLFHAFIMEKQKRVSPKTIGNYWAVHKNLMQFINYKKYEYIHEIRIPFMKQYNDILYSKFSASHIKRNLNAVVAFCKWCVNMEYLDYNPVRDYEIEVPKENKQIVSLNLKELHQLKSVQVCSRLNNVRQLFLIQTYTGLSYSDLLNTDVSNIFIYENTSYLVGKRMKTGIEFNVPLTETAEKLLRNLPKLKIISNQKYNIYLKELALAAGINKRLTTHVARRTCGQLYLNLGYSIEAVSRMLGHSDIKTTQKHYARASFERVHNETLKIAS